MSLMTGLETGDIVCLQTDLSRRCYGCSPAEPITATTHRGYNECYRPRVKYTRSVLMSDVSNACLHHIFQINKPGVPDLNIESSVVLLAIDVCATTLGTEVIRGRGVIPHNAFQQDPTSSHPPCVSLGLPCTFSSVPSYPQGERIGGTC